MKSADKPYSKTKKLGNLIKGLDHCGQRLGLMLIRGYEYSIRPVLGPSCRFLPSCSEYARQALQSHGTAKGVYLSLKRLCRCHPLHPGGIDEVPDAYACRGTKPADQRPIHKSASEQAAP
jgi:putative membrane protein insertion efficiency factor